MLRLKDLRDEFYISATSKFLAGGEMDTLEIMFNANATLAEGDDVKKCFLQDQNASVIFSTSVLCIAKSMHNNA